MNTSLSLGYSPCPNDTFIFYGLVHGKTPPSAGVKFSQPLLEDVEQLNQWALAGRLDVTKMSFHAFGHVQDEYCVLAAGSALGRGCGPLLVARTQVPTPELRGKRIAIPGRLTTATLLLQLFLPNDCELVPLRFDRIIEAVATGAVDGGVIIHESRFTYQDRGLVCLQDLGQWWEGRFGLPIPLGCIAARRSLGRETLMAVERAIRASVDYAFSHGDECLPYIRSQSQEMDLQVIHSHIGLYVNDFTRDLGVEGFAAIDTFLDMGRKAGVLPASRRGMPAGVGGT